MEPKSNLPLRDAISTPPIYNIHNHNQHIKPFLIFINRNKFHSLGKNQRETTNQNQDKTDQSEKSENLNFEKRRESDPLKKFYGKYTRKILGKLYTTHCVGGI